MAYNVGQKSRKIQLMPVLIVTNCLLLACGVRFCNCFSGPDFIPRSLSRSERDYAPPESTSQPLIAIKQESECESELERRSLGQSLESGAERRSLIDSHHCSRLMVAISMANLFFLISNALIKGMIIVLSQISISIPLKTNYIA